MNEEKIIKRELLVSIRPDYAEKIVTGHKTVELRRRFPADLPRGSIIYIYSTSPTQAIIGSAVVSSVERLELKNIWKHHSKEACINREAFDAYFIGTTEGYAISLSNAIEFHNSLKASDLRERFGFTAPQSFMYVSARYSTYLNHERSKTINRY